jgi:hypothetical protein
VSVVAVIQLTSATVTTLYAHENTIENTSTDRKRIIGLLQILQQALNGVREAVENASDASVELLTLTKLLESPEGLPRYRVELENLRTKFKTIGSLDHLEPLIWPMKEGYVKKTLEYLRNFQQLLSSALNTDHLCVSGNKFSANSDRLSREVKADVQTDVKALGESAAWMEHAGQRVSFLMLVRVVISNPCAWFA